MARPPPCACHPAAEWERLYAHGSVVADLSIGSQRGATSGILCDGLGCPACARALPAAIEGRRAFTSGRQDLSALEPWAWIWYRWVSAAYLRGYFARASEMHYLPALLEHRKLLLDVFMLERALQELSLDLQARPGWAAIPMRGILQLLEGRS